MSVPSDDPPCKPPAWFGEAQAALLAHLEQNVGAIAGFALELQEACRKDIGATPSPAAFTLWIKCAFLAIGRDPAAAEDARRVVTRIRANPAMSEEHASDLGDLLFSHWEKTLPWALGQQEGPDARAKQTKAAKAAALVMRDAGLPVDEVAQTLRVKPDTITAGWGLHFPRAYTCLDCDKGFPAPSRGPLPTRCPACKKAYHAAWRSRPRSK